MKTNAKISKREMLRRRKRTETIITIFVASLILIIPFMYGQTKSCVNSAFIAFYICTLIIGALSGIKENGILFIITMIQSSVLLSWLLLN